jgi:hypothetical protein
MPMYLNTRKDSNFFVGVAAQQEVNDAIAFW